MNHIEIHIEHTPIPFARMRTNGGRHFIPKKQRDYMDYVRTVASRVNPMDGAVALTVFFAMPRPKYHYNKRGEVLSKYAYTPCSVKPDIDNLYKLLVDSLNGIAYRDDAQIVQVTMTKYYDIDGRTIVIVRPNETHKEG